MIQPHFSRANNMTLEEVLAHLANDEAVEGIALFGSLPEQITSAVSDYDLLLLVTQPPVGIFQMQTSIDGLMADVAFVETEVAERILALDEPVPATSPEGFLIGWLENAQIVYDGKASPGRLSRIQRKLETRDWRLPASDSDLYADAFWLNFDLRHIQRMAASDDPVYQTALDIHLMTNLAQLCRVYCRCRGIHWRGAKAAVRHLQAHDPDYLGLFRQCTAESDRARRVRLFEQLVKQTLSPLGDQWPAGSTIVTLKNPAEQPARVGEALAFWESLLRPL